MKKTMVLALVSVAAIGVQAALITNEGASIPTGAIAENVATASVGNRELSWRSDTIHSEVGQSFVATSDGVAKGISLFITTPEDFTLYETPVTFKLKVFSGVTHLTAVELGSYSYDASGLNVSGSTIDDTWLRFGLDSGVSMTSGNAYSFILTFNSLDADHRVNFQRTTNDAYTNGDELRPASLANLYDAANFDTDPWDADSSYPLGAIANGDLRFAVDTIPEPATLGLVALVGGALLFTRRIFTV